MFFKRRNALIIPINKGVTLIELLVVITIMMTMMTLVGPLAINTVDKAEAQSEYLSFCGILRSASVKAFANGSGINMSLNQNGIVAFVVQLKIGDNQEQSSTEHEIIIDRTYEFLNFPNTELKFNKNGMPNLTTIKFKQRNKIRQLDLIALLE
jgi:prepilin-type N-terminal cleavage/methylation domain-containing protein